MSDLSKKILLCDDSLLVRVQLKEFLLNYNSSFEIIEASDGEQAVEKYIDNNPDLVFLDIVMPQVDGLECLKRIKDYDQDAKVVIISSIGNQVMLREALKAGAMNFIQKPWNEEGVKKVLETL
ncbi:response regulator [Serpentinicella alkaliphila]|uniref:Stage 0 sporulation protein A homolog n=1 Tax=Serpentinicella alkaliphila TaxID=1734049 RepID=A0A4R2TGF2_9FIRM|nr:response regulator [Serpentinicella alkaliphila]QUH25011.1 response regulator [Serpentinicella alkaliphila]TCQ02508.1 two-component system chemotaxis response regulator CheY [Serpentinicella alkaliphila]